AVAGDLSRRGAAALAARCRFQATRRGAPHARARSFRAGKRGGTPGQVVSEPLADAVRICSFFGLDRTRASPNDGPAGPQGGSQARGSFVSGQATGPPHMASG